MEVEQISHTYLRWVGMERTAEVNPFRRPEGERVTEFLSFSRPVSRGQDRLLSDTEDLTTTGLSLGPSSK